MAEQLRCVGTASFVTLLRIRSLALSDVQVASSVESLQGNDSVLVSKALSDFGWDVECHLLGATATDVGTVRRMGVNATGDEVPGALSQSTGLEDETGQRSWILSRAPISSGEIALTSARQTYFDVYDEIEDRVVDLLQAHLKLCPDSFVNVGQHRPLAKAKRVRFASPSVVQSSWTASDAPSADDLLACATRVRELSSARYSIATGGRLGSAVAGPNGVHYEAPPRELPQAILGAGAVYSAAIIRGLRRGLRSESELAAVGTRAVHDFAVLRAQS